MSEAAVAAAAPSAPSAPLTEAGASPSTEKETRPSPGQKAPPSEPKAKASQPALPELFEIKVDGKVVKMTRDEMIQHASLGHASDRRFKEAAQMRKQAEAVIGRLKDPSKAIEALMDPALGLSKDQIREAFEGWYAKEFIEPESLSPEQKKLREYEAKLQKYADEEKGREEQKQKEHLESLTTQAREELQNQLIETLKVSNLSPTNFTLRRLAHWTSVNRANGFDAPPQVLASQVQNDLKGIIRDITQSSDGESLVQLFEGTDILQKLRKYDLEQLRKTRGQPQAVASEPTPSEASSGRRLTSAEVTQRMRQLQKSGRY